ncbi:hypothetical protein F4781DRAFT_416270 [Annulohypoxylon bovei var. microspora]|nr:hypothetical protein F4781DRAFT_416270 [Annulohypoxylon bovei var. microspora]
MLLKLIAVTVALFAATSQAQIQLVNISATDGISDTCIAVLNQQVTCDGTLASAGDVVQNSPVFGTPLFLNSSQLTTLCTTTCQSSLATWERRIAGACGSTLYEQPDGSMAAPPVFAERFAEIFNSMCLKNAAGAFCNLVIGSVLSIDPTNQQATGTPVSTAFCDDCYLSLVSTQLAMPIASTSIMASDFAILTSSCQKTGWSLSPPPTATNFTIRPPATSSTAPSCTGTTHTVTSSDTCVGISMSEGISTDDLTSYNLLSSMCNYFPTTGATLCIPSYRKCKPYKVQTNDTCSSLQSQFSINYAQLTSWNPSLGPKCSNIASYVGYVICSSNPGGDWVNPSPTNATTTSRPSDPPLWTTTLTPMSMYPNATYVASSAGAPYGNLTRMDCDTYATAPILTNYTINGTTSFACEDVVKQYGVTMDNFLDWNPSLNGTSPCVMANNTQYCVATYATISPGIVGACIQTDIATSGYDCNGFMAIHGLDKDRFSLWNPGVGTNCENFKVGTYYCTAVAHYKQPGITSNCNLFASPNDTDWANLPCQEVETQYGISHDRFVAWNPAVLDNCTGLYMGYDYCVSIPNYRPTYTTTMAVGTAFTTSSLTSETTSVTDIHASSAQTSVINSSNTVTSTT